MDYQWALILGLVMLCFGFILEIVFKLLSIRQTMTAPPRQPPLDQEMYKEYASKHEIEAMEKRIVAQITALSERFDRTYREIFATLRQFELSTSKTFQDTMGFIRRVEGILEEHTKREAE